jgi:hypothetical protein
MTRSIGLIAGMIVVCTWTASSAMAECNRDTRPGRLLYSNGNSRQFVTARLSGGTRLEFVRSVSELSSVTDLAKLPNIAVADVASISLSAESSQATAGFVIRRGSIQLKDGTSRPNVFLILGIRGHPKFLESRSYVVGPKKEEWNVDDPWPGASALVQRVEFDK